MLSRHYMENDFTCASSCCCDGKRYLTGATWEGWRGMPNLEAIALIQLQSHVILKVNIISLNFCWTVPSLGDEYSLPMSPCPQMTGLLWTQPVLIARLKESILWNQKPLCDFPCFCYVLWVIHLHMTSPGFSDSFSYIRRVWPQHVNLSCHHSRRADKASPLIQACVITALHWWWYTGIQHGISGLNSNLHRVLGTNRSCYTVVVWTIHLWKASHYWFKWNSKMLLSKHLNVVVALYVAQTRRSEQHFSWSGKK